jgi:hypothetical protein
LREARAAAVATWLNRPTVKSDHDPLSALATELSNRADSLERAMVSGRREAAPKSNSRYSFPPNLDRRSFLWIEN